MAVRLVALMRRNRTVLFLLFLIFLLVTIILKSLTTTPSSLLLTGSASDPVICDESASAKEQMKDVFVRSVAVLQTLNLQHFLCYDSLWAALSSRKNAFDWKSFNELCLLNEDVSKVEEAAVIRAFRREGLKLSYFTSTGEYDIKVEDDDNQVTRLKIFLFERDLVTDNMRRVGWKHRILPPDSCSLIHCFPPHLLDSPLPKAQFYGIEVSVPKEGMEIQKYHYPDNWWRSSREPYECAQNMR